MSWWKTVVREPLVHFVVIGAALFAFDAWRSGGERDARVEDSSSVPAAASAMPVSGQRASIVVDADVRGQIAAQAERRLGRTATEPELAEETDRWIDEEVLYREAQSVAVRCVVPRFSPLRPAPPLRSCSGRRTSSPCAASIGSASRTG